MPAPENGPAASVELIVSSADTAARLGVGAGEAYPEVLATRTMVGEMERAAAKLLHPHLRVSNSCGLSYVVATCSCCQESIMSTDAVVRARIDGQVKEEAAAVLAEMGLSVSDAIRMMLVRVAAEKAMPFEVRVPNAKTAAAMRASDRNEGITHAKDADEMFRKLGI